MARIEVAGRPIPQGSLRAVRGRDGGPIRLAHSNASALGAWRSGLASAWAESGLPYIDDGPVFVSMAFYVLRPKAARRRHRPHVAPDLDKYVRAVLDALTGSAFHDDGQVVALNAGKWYCDEWPTIGAERSVIIVERVSAS
jgi:Holliday junction resolvase RusA-like endonuclease